MCKIIIKFRRWEREAERQRKGNIKTAVDRRVETAKPLNTLRTHLLEA